MDRISDLQNLCKKKKKRVLWTWMLHIPLTVSLVTDGQKKTLTVEDQTLCVTAGLWVHSFMPAKPAALYFLLMLLMYLLVMFKLLCCYFNIKLSFAHGQFEQWMWHYVMNPPPGGNTSIVFWAGKQRFRLKMSRLEFIYLTYAQMMGFNRPFQFLSASLCLLQELNLWFTVALFFFLCLLQAISRRKTYNAFKLNL